jgi:hypothetical protein
MTTSANETGGQAIENNDGERQSPFVRSTVKSEICKQVLRCKLAKRRHLVLKEAFDPRYLDSLFPMLLKLFEPQHVTYNGGIANVKNWKISCYLEVMDGGVPTTHPHLALRDIFLPVLNACNELFLYWYRQQHACNTVPMASRSSATSCHRLMTFVTRYTPAPGEQALLKVRANGQLILISIRAVLSNLVTLSHASLTLWPFFSMLST